jgi:hypothetical protein
MIKNFKQIFNLFILKTMVQSRRQVQNNKGRTIDNRAKYAPRLLIDCRKHNQQHQGCYTE